MNNDERIIKYLDGELQEEEKALFEKDLSRSETLRNELAAYKKVLTAFDEQKSFDTESTYFTNLVPAIREKAERRKTVNPFRKPGFAVAFVLLFIVGYFVFQLLFISSSEKIITIDEFTDSMTEQEIDELIGYLDDGHENVLFDENLYNIEENDLENIISASTYETKLAIISYYGINDFLADLPETESDKIYNELINKNFSIEANL